MVPMETARETCREWRDPLRRGPQPARQPGQRNESLLQRLDSANHQFVMSNFLFAWTAWYSSFSWRTHTNRLLACSVNKTNIAGSYWMDRDEVSGYFLTAS